MVDLSWVHQVEILLTGFGYAPEVIRDATVRLNSMLKDGWRLIAVVNDTKVSLHFDSPHPVTESYYIIGR